jgi:hypothetical protein
MSTEPQDFHLEKPVIQFEMQTIREGDKEINIPLYNNHLLSNENGKFPCQLTGWEEKVRSIEANKDGFLGWYRNPQQPGPSSLGIAYFEDEYKILRPDFIFFGQNDDGVYADLIDPHGTHLSDALPKLQGLVIYAQKFEDHYRRIESVAEIDQQLRTVDLKDPSVQVAILSAESAKSVFSSDLAKDYL